MFRTEFLYMDRHNFPSEEEQFEVYKLVAENAGESSVVIRTLDIGGDKRWIISVAGREPFPGLSRHPYQPGSNRAVPDPAVRHSEGQRFW